VPRRDGKSLPSVEAMEMEGRRARGKGWKWKKGNQIISRQRGEKARNKGQNGRWVLAKPEVRIQTMRSAATATPVHARSVG